jgi:hypothetical protein
MIIIIYIYMIKFTAYNTSSPIPLLTSKFIPQHLHGSTAGGEYATSSEW